MLCAFTCHYPNIAGVRLSPKSLAMESANMTENSEQCGRLLIA